MFKFLVYSISLAFGLLSVLSGCVSPGPEDTSLLGRSQRALAQRGPQERLSEEGLGSLEPDDATYLPAFEVIEDEQSGRRIIHLSLDEALAHALVNNLDIRVVSYDPSISRQQIIEEAAEFDYAVFGSASSTKEDRRTASTFAASQTKTRAFEAGIKQKFVTGAEWSLSWALIRTWDDSSAFPPDPNPNYEPTLVFEITQPLLRDGWPKVNTADLRRAKINQKFAMIQFRQKLEEVSTDVISSYWSLIQARREVEIADELLVMAKLTQQRVEGRKELDATSVQIEQANEKVEARRAILIQTRKFVYDAQDRLAKLLADPQINVLGDVEIVPSGSADIQKRTIDTDDRLETALAHNPVLQQARLAIELAEIDVDVAEHQKLPELNFTGRAALQGLDDSPGDANNRLYDGDYFGWSVGLSMEYPLGNRLAEAQLRRSKFNRLKAITSLQNFSDQVAVLVRERIRQVESSYEQWEVQKAAVKAAAAQLQALEDTEEIRGQLTPEFLQLKLQAQEALARAQQSEQGAITDYNIALAELDQATGTVLELYPVKKALPFVAGDPFFVESEDGSVPEGSEQTILLDIE